MKKYFSYVSGSQIEFIREKKAGKKQARMKKEDEKRRMRNEERRKNRAEERQRKNNRKDLVNNSRIFL